MEQQFKMNSSFLARGDQAKAIEFLSAGVKSGKAHQLLVGVTGSGKTYTMAKVIEACNRPSIVIAHNKTLAAQLFREFRHFFPSNHVEYFVSYYDYYQPEAYIPSTDTYIEKDSSINEDLDRMRHSATQALMEYRDAIIIASVSCIYGLGAPADYAGMLIKLCCGLKISRMRVLERLVELQYTRNDIYLARGKFRVRGDTLEVFGVSEHDAYRVEFFGDEIDRITRIDPLRGSVLQELSQITIFPATHYVTPPERMPIILESIREELNAQIKDLDGKSKLLERQRLIERTEYDLEMLELTNYCSGIENYSRHLTGRAPGEPPPTLIDYLPDDALVFIDESHVTLPQLQAMYRGDYSRKRVLVDFGFRLPSAVDNRPLKFEEFQSAVKRVIYVSATPSKFEYRMAENQVVEQITRPTGLLDPEVEIRGAKHQVDDLYGEIKARAQKHQRTLITTLTKKLAEDLAEYYLEAGLKVVYLHSDVATLDRIQIIRDLRSGKYDALIGVNLLREGLDLPEVSLVAIMDADKEGFLRSMTSLIQTIGRCARHIEGKAILYADSITQSMQFAIDETDRRRKVQSAYNESMGITPKSVEKDLDLDFYEISNTDGISTADMADDPQTWSFDDALLRIAGHEKEMHRFAAELKFEEAAQIRDKIRWIQKLIRIADRDK